MSKKEAIISALEKLKEEELSSLLSSLKEAKDAKNSQEISQENE